MESERPSGPGSAGDSASVTWAKWAPAADLTTSWVRGSGMMEFMRPEPDDKPVLPAKTEEEADVGWGEAPEPDDDERLRRERPPHWGRVSPAITAVAGRQDN